MSKTLLDYAVSFTQVEGTNATSLAFLHNLGVIVAPTATPATATITNAAGNTITPATFELEGFFLAGTIITASGTKTDTPPLTWNAPYTLTENMTATQLAVAFADFIKGNDQMTATANGNVIELLAINGGLTVTVDLVDVDETGATPLESSIIEVTDPADLPSITDNEDVIAAFDGGLSRVYLILLVNAADLPALLVDKECDFYTIYGTTDFTPAELIPAMANWQGVQGLSFGDQAAAATYAATTKCSGFYENTTEPLARAYFGIYSFAVLLAANAWRNQQYAPINPANGAPVTELGAAESLFDDRVSFYLTDEEQGTRLAFFVAGNKSITEPYITEEIQVVIQSEMLAFISNNQPMNIETNRRLLEQVGNRVLESYLDNGLLDPAGENSVSITTSNEAFIVNGQIITADVEALWRVQLDALESVVL